MKPLGNWLTFTNINTWRLTLLLHIDFSNLDTVWICAAGDFRECSQILNTRIPHRLDWRATFIWRFLFCCIFSDQNLLRVFGTCPHFGQPCQKQPSTKTATLCFMKKKSGAPGRSVACCLHPRTPALTKAIRNTCSVERVCLPRIPAIIRERAGATFLNLPPGNVSLSLRSNWEYNSDVTPPVQATCEFCQGLRILASVEDEVGF